MSRHSNKRQATSPLNAGFDGHVRPDFHDGYLDIHARRPRPVDQQSLRSQVDIPEPEPFSLNRPMIGQQKSTQGTLSIVDWNTSTAPAIGSSSLSERCIDSFYHHFHASHPFVLPQKSLNLVIQMDGDGAIEPLLAAMRWVGSLYLDLNNLQEGLLDNAQKLVHTPGRLVNGFLLQAMLVLIVGLDGSDQQEKARQLLSEAGTMSVEMGFHTREFASLHGRGSNVMEESWRRTWWELFVVDAMIAGAHRSTNFPLYDISADVALPCEEHQYISGDIPRPLTLEELDEQEFSDQDHDFSSFAYRILSAKILGKFMRMPPIFGPEDENIARIEAALTNFRLHLPSSKRNATQINGKMDEMMFQALMINNATSIILHQPFSQLDSSSTQCIDACAPHQVVYSWDAFNDHTRHTIAAATEISKMVTNRTPLTSHTHFFACIVTLSSIVHLSKWAMFFVPRDDDDLRQQIRLNIGALKEMATVWQAAERTKHQVRDVAQEIYRLKKQQQENSQYWLGWTQQQMLDSIATDESIIDDIENIQSNSISAFVPSMPAGND
ncbi:hypothetical protein HJFPF1_03636 [Paramyrothecium foliicola]|nr:hypothetical protein HJFPF1_03636 [Paramyrothecium foliicola]